MKQEQDKDCDQEDLELEENLIKELNELWVKVEMYGYQRVWNTWLGLGDFNEDCSKKGNEESFKNEE